MKTNETVQKAIKKAMGLALSLTLTLSLCSSALAYSSTSIQASKVTNEMKIDGDLAEWDKSSPLIVNKEEQVVRDVGQWTGPEDCSIEVYVMWDAQTLYLAATVMDDTPLMYREGFPPDMADSMVMFLSTDPNADPDRSEYTATDFRVTQIIDDYYFCNGISRDMIADNKGFENKGADGDEQVLEGFECAINEIEGGYTYESKIPLSNFANDQIEQLLPTNGMTVGFECGMFDLDFPCPGVATVRIESAASDAVDTNPSLWGTLTFVEK